MLPSDRYLAELLGLTDEQYAYWKDEVRKRSLQGPQPAVVAGIDPISIAIQVAIAIGVSLIAAALAPSPPKRGGELRQRRVTGNTQTSLQSLAPRAGFDAVQEVAGIGEPIPVIYANRETIDGITYGGVRVNATLLWSQIWSLGGSQMLRAVFMLGEGPLAGIDPLGFAIGDNSIGAYDLGSREANNSSARITIYHRPDGGRIGPGNRIVGRTAANDPGNAVNAGAADVFMARGAGGSYAAVFSAAAKPSTSTTFGVYQLIGNNLGVKINPQVRPGVTARLKPRGSKGNSDVVCDLDQTVQVQRLKEAAFFSSRSGVVAGQFTLGDNFTYRLDRSSDYLTSFQSSGTEGVTWSASAVVASRPVIYKRGTQTRIGGFDFAARMTVSAVSIASGADALEVTATFDVATVLQRLIDEDAARGQYLLQYWIRATDGDQVIESPFDITITIQSDQGITQTKNGDGLVTNVTISSSSANNVYTFEAEVDDDSGPVEALASPNRLRSSIVFPVEELDAYEETAADVASTVAGRQKNWDDALVVGELYKCGSALAICSARTPADRVFVSDSEDGANGTGISINASFEVVRGGTAAVARR
jgi:hypothetical protein